MAELRISYECVIGLEIHIHLNTAAKIFAPEAVTYGAPPNTHLSPLTIGHPGTLPYLNKGVIERAIKIGLATNCSIASKVGFARKNYFYADLPKGYQITQDQNPICSDGFLDIQLNEKAATKRIGIERIHLEEDAGKSSHDQEAHTAVDLNRAGSPLIELVTKPDIRTADEAVAFVASIRQLVRYLGISEANMEKGQLRCDANVSIRPLGSSKLGQRTETKNLNSLRNVKRAIEYEFKRQIGIAKKEGIIEMATLTWDEQRNSNFAIRSKEQAHDYRYFPEPDLPPLLITEAQLTQLKAQQPELASERKRRYQNELGLSLYDATLITEDLADAQYFDQLIAANIPAKQAANWLGVHLRAWCNENQKTISEFPLAPEKVAALIRLVIDGAISSSVAAQQLLPLLLENPNANPQELAKKNQLILKDDDDWLLALIDATLEKYPDKVKAYKQSKKAKGLIGLFMGDIMKAAKGKADPQKTKKLLSERLSA